MTPTTPTTLLERGRPQPAVRTRQDGPRALVVEVGAPISGGAVSVVVPTRNEAPGVAELLRRLAALPAGLVAEVLFVDDSDDATPGEVLEGGRRCPFPVVLVHRRSGHRPDGLSGAVLGGFAEARAPWVCVMDADLQHPPALLADLHRTGVGGAGADVVCASRYCGAGSAPEFGWRRTAVSRASTMAAKALFPRRLRGVSDPLSGYFLVRTATVRRLVLRPTGFKILLELLVRGDLTRAEVPFRFGSRFAGETKACAREGLRFFRHLVRLRTAPA